jgi:GT2 family glycosyltransferase
LWHIRNLENAKRRILAEERNRLKSELIQQFTEPMGKLLALYMSRPDLQSAFPETKKGDYSRLLQWARSALSPGQDDASPLLAHYAEWYRQNVWLERSRLEEELSSANRELAQRQSTIQSLETERVGLGQQLSNASRELAQRESTIQSLEADRTKLVEQLGKANDEKAKLAEDLSKAKYELSAVAEELEAIKVSFGYHVMRSYAKRIDRLFPEGTRRGEGRRIVVAGFGIVGREGIRSFVRQAWEKLKKREFRIVEPKKSYSVTLDRQYPAIVKEVPLEPQAQEQILKVRLNLFLSQPSVNLVFPLFTDPLVSIVIPTFNRAEHLYQCLESILAFADVPFELIVVDDCSSDATPDLLKKCSNVQIVRNERNLEFIGTCNRGASLAKGRYILFLNNDVSATPRWLSTLVKTMEQYPKCGAVGAKLVRPNGTLQEAGSIVWQDGSALGYGRDDDPLKPECCYLREVDYCSAACLLVRAELFQKLGGFDELYLPAYYEDSDLCIAIRKLGYKVVYQPQATVFHHEFGSRSFERAEALCEANRPKFAKKWARILQKQHPRGDVLRARDRRQGKRVLVMDDQIPAPYMGIGLPRAHKMLSFLSELGYIVTFAPCHPLPLYRTPWQPTTHELQQLGIEMFYGDSFNPEELVRSRSGNYDIVIVSRPHNGARFLSLTRRYFPDALIIYDAEALFCIREILKAQVEGRELSEMEKRKMLREELDVMKEADVVITVSEAEREIITKEDAHHDVVVWGHTHDSYEPATTFPKRRDILFVGGFTHGHPPNIDAVVHFATEVFPKIREKLPECRFIVVGIQPPECIQKLASQHVVVAGFVEDPREYYEKCRAFVAPLRFSAGINYKLTEAMSYGIPSVVSTVAAQGLFLQDEREALIARDDDDFAEKAIRLYTDEALWLRVQKGAQRYVQNNCSPQMMKRKLAEILTHRAKRSSTQRS